MADGDETAAHPAVGKWRRLVQSRTQAAAGLQMQTRHGGRRLRLMRRLRRRMRVGAGGRRPAEAIRRRVFSVGRRSASPIRAIRARRASRQAETVDRERHAILRAIAGQHLLPARLRRQRQILADAFADGQQAVAHRLRQQHAPAQAGAARKGEEQRADQQQVQSQPQQHLGVERTAQFHRPPLPVPAFTAARCPCRPACNPRCALCG